MKNKNAFQNISRLVLALLLASMLFFSPMNIKLNDIPQELPQDLLKISSLALSAGTISEEEFDSISTTLMNVTGPLSRNEVDAASEAASLIGMNSEKVIRVYQHRFIAHIESEEVEARTDYSQSLVSAAIAIPDVIKLVQGCSALNDDSMTNEDVAQTVEKATQAVNKNSVQTLLAVYMLISEYSGLLNLQYIFCAIIILLIFSYSFVVFPFSALKFAIKQISEAVKEKGEWLNKDNTKDFLENGKKLLVPLGIMLITPLMLPGTTFTLIYYLYAASVLVWLASLAKSSFSKTTVEEVFKKSIASIITVALLIVALLVAVLVCVNLANFDALNAIDVIKNNESMDMSFLTVAKSLAALCMYITIHYIAGSLLRLALFDNTLSAKHIRLIFTSVLALLYGYIINFTANSILILILYVVLFALEVAFRSFRNDYIEFKYRKIAENLIPRLNALNEKKLISEEDYKVDVEFINTNVLSIDEFKFRHLEKIKFAISKVEELEKEAAEAEAEIAEAPANAE